MIKRKNRKQKLRVLVGCMMMTCCISACSSCPKQSPSASNSQATTTETGKLSGTSERTEITQKTETTEKTDKIEGTETTEGTEMTETSEDMENVFEPLEGIPMGTGNDLLHKVSRTCPPEWNGVSYYQAFRQFFMNQMWKTEEDYHENTIVVFTGDCKFQEAQSSISIRFITDMGKNTVLPYELKMNDNSQDVSLLYQLIETAFQTYDPQKDDPLEEARSLYKPILDAYRQMAEKGVITQVGASFPGLIRELDDEYFFPTNQLAKHPIFYTLRDIAYDSEPELLISQYVNRNDNPYYSLADIWTIRNGQALRICPLDNEEWYDCAIRLYQGRLISCQYSAGTSRSGYKVYYMDPYTWSLQKKDDITWNAFSDRGELSIPNEETDRIIRHYHDIERNLLEFEWTKLADIR